MRMCGYARVSTDEEKQLDSLEHQTAFFTEFAALHGHHLVHVYADEGISGRQLKKRDAFNKMMRDSEVGLFDILVVKDVSRFARNTVDLLTSVRQLKARGIEVLFVNNSQKVLGESEFIITLLGAVAQEESANLSNRVKFGKAINSKKGRVPPWIFGYDRIDNFTLQVNERESEAVREIYRLYVKEGYGCRLIAIKLAEEGYEPKFGGQWNPRGVRRVLENPIYCGHYINHKYAVRDFLDGAVKPLPEEEHYHHERPEWAIISPELFQEAQEVLQKRRKQYETTYVHSKGRYSNRHLFSTLIRCEDCGKAFSRRCVHYPNSDYIYWRCPTNNEYTAKRCPNNTILREDDLIDALSSYLKKILNDREAFATMLAEKYMSQRREDPQRVNIKELEGKKAKLQKSREKYMDMYTNELIPMEMLKKKMSEINVSIESIDDKLLMAQSETCATIKIEDAIDAAMKEIEDFLELKNSTNVDLRRILDCITVDHEKHVKIHLKIQNLQQN